MKVCFDVPFNTTSIPVWPVWISTISLPHLAQQLWGEQPVAPVSRKEAEILQLNRDGLGRHLITPAARLNDLASPLEREGHFGIGETTGGFHIDYDWTCVREQQIVWDVLPWLAVDRSSEQEWLSHDAPHTAVKVCKK
jgi:hypothetical protein